jgi:glutamine synthetase
MSNIASLARVPVVTDIRFNEARINESGNIMNKWSQVNNELSQKDQELLGEDVVNSYSAMKVEEYINFSKTFTPYLRWE